MLLLGNGAVSIAPRQLQARHMRGRPLPIRLKGYLPTLDGWRAVAILAVIVWHLTMYAPKSHRWLVLDVLLGTKGVELFFGISGLLITSRLLEEWRTRGSVSLRQFYIRRAFRILPPAFAYLAV